MIELRLVILYATASALIRPFLTSVDKKETWVYNINKNGFKGEFLCLEQFTEM